MKYIRGISKEPYFNLAAEHVLFGRRDEIFMLWQNKPSVIIGRNQNAMAEIDYDYVKENKITVARRISGGGAVFHDDGNVNFTYLVNGKSFGDFDFFTRQLLEFLNANGCPAYLEGRNDLLVDGFKFSGNAQKIQGDRMMHHGCILFDSDMDRLSGALRPDPEKIKSKGVASVRKRVCNLKQYLDMDTEEFIDRLEAWMVEKEKLERYELTKEDIDEIEKVRREQFATHDWIYGAACPYSFHKKGRFTGGTIEFYLDVRHGRIEDCKIYGDFFASSDVSVIENALIGVRHEEQSVRNALASSGADNIITGIGIEQMISLLF